MKRLVVQGALMVIGVEFLALRLRQRQFVLWTAGIAIAVPLLGIRRLLGASNREPGLGQAIPDEAGDSLRHWLASTESRIHFSESTRMDWDRRWRPILARRFEISTGQRHNKDPVAFDATGRMLFGAELWEWVDPGNVARAGGHEPGPGRAALAEILHRLEQR